MSDNIGIYIHVPFCDGKCPYCDFYSLHGTDELMDNYTNSVIEHIKYYSGILDRCADTLYFGGGTPNLLGAKRLIKILEAVQKYFGLNDAEITVEANPGGDLSDFFCEIRAAGINRLSLGLQSANDDELLLLGRKHNAKQAAKTVVDAQTAGFDNISLDLMLAVQNQTAESLSHSIEVCSKLNVQHISAYLLTVEPRTAYGKNRAALRLPDEDTATALYLRACGELEKHGFRQYEISNFAKSGRESRHNLKYWHCEEYLGLGPAAHSFIDGKRFHFERSIGAFIRGEPPVKDGGGGDFEEFAMLALRLTEGLTDKNCRARFDRPVPDRLKRAAKLYENGGFTVCTPDSFYFTPKGFLVSNTLTAEILFSK